MLVPFLVTSTLLMQRCEAWWWPRPEALVGFWPLTKDTNITNIASNSAIGNKVPDIPSAGYLYNKEGPFGVLETSYSKDEQTNPIIHYAGGIVLPASFTMSCYLLAHDTSSNQKGGMLEFYKKSGYRLHFVWKDTSVQLVYGNDTYVQRLESNMDTLTLNDEWRFVAVTFEATSKLLNLYMSNAGNITTPPQNTQLVESTTQLSIQSQTDNDLSIGHAFLDGENVSYNMKAGDSISCVMIYNVALSEAEIKNDLPAACQSKDIITTSTSTTKPTPVFTTAVITEGSESAIESLMVSVPLEPANSTKLGDFTDDIYCHDFDVNRAAPPNNGNPTQIDVGFEVRSLEGINTVEQTISVNGLLFMGWSVTTCPKDNKSRLASDDQRLRVTSPDEVWTPIIRYTSSATCDVLMTNTQPNDDLLAIYRATDTPTHAFDFYWTREAMFTSSCKLALANFPYDQQTCSFVFEFQRGLNLVQFSNPAIFIWSKPVSEEWKVLSYHSQIQQSSFKNTPVHRVQFNVTLQRIPDYYVNNLALPNFLLAFLVLFSFCMPPDCPDRAMFAVTALLALTVGQSDVLQQLPKIAGRVLLGDFVRAMTWFTAGVAVYLLMSCWLATSFEKLSNDKMMRKCISSMRMIDLIFFAICVASFAGTVAFFLNKANYLA